jgi:Spy/CpxP family protein refolding chaperone
MSELPSPERPSRRRGRAVAGILVVALAGGLIGAFATTSFSQGFGPPWHMTMMGPMRGPFGGPMTPEQMADRADRMVRHLAIEIDASADQQAKLETIVKGVTGDVAPVRDKMAAARRQMRELLTQATVDRGAIEKLRAEQVATLDTVSKRIAQAVGDAADVLTPDQRRKIGDMLPAAGGPGRGGPGGGYWHGLYRD